MDGPSHYQHAEVLADMASEDETGSEMERFHLAKAQVHATLALAAATGLQGINSRRETLDYAGWCEVTASPAEVTP
jgi:hypothetical protein